MNAHAIGAKMRIAPMMATRRNTGPLTLPGSSGGLSSTGSAPPVGSSRPIRSSSLISLSSWFGSVEEDCLLYFSYRPGDLDPSGAGVGAVEYRSTSPDPTLLIHHLESLPQCAISGIEDEAVCIDDRRWADVAVICPVGGAGAGTGAAEDTLGGVVVEESLIW